MNREQWLNKRTQRADLPPLTSSTPPRTDPVATDRQSKLSSTTPKETRRNDEKSFHEEVISPNGLPRSP